MEENWERARGNLSELEKHTHKNTGTVELLMKDNNHKDSTLLFSLIVLYIPVNELTKDPFSDWYTSDIHV